MDFSFASRKDLPELLALFQAATRSMDAQGIHQWDEIYPDKTVLSEDIECGIMRSGK